MVLQVSDVKKDNYYVWFHVTLHFMGIKNSVKVCNTKSAIACNIKKEPTHVSMIARKRLVILVFICIDLNIIQTSPSCLWGVKCLDKKPRLCLGFFILVFKFRKHSGLGLYYIHIWLMINLSLFKNY